MKITEKYRPRKLSEVAAQTSSIIQIEHCIARSGLAGSSWWITGETGTGKTTIAKILAEEFCQNDFTVMELVGRDVSVEDLREYERRMAFFPMGSGRCLVINEAQDLSDSAVSLLLSLVEKINVSKHDMVVFTAMVDVLELKKDPMNRWRALTGRCNLLSLSDASNPLFRQEVVEYLEGIAANEGIKGIDIQTICEQAHWSIRAALNILDMKVPEGKPVESVALSVTEKAVTPSQITVKDDKFFVKDRATLFEIGRLGNRWKVTLENHMTKAHVKGGRIQKFFGTLEEIEATYKSLKGLTDFSFNQ